MIGGIDLGGTKIEARVFDDTFTEITRHRIPTPTANYAALIDALAEVTAWMTHFGPLDAIGLGSPGLINPRTGMMLTANLPASGHSLARGLTKKITPPVTVINDANAMTLAEATVGAAKGYRNVVGLIIGTGVAGGHTIGGALSPDLNGQNGEFGHIALPATFISSYGLPILPCGCGAIGCFETYLSGPGLEKLAFHMTGISATAPEIMTQMPQVRTAWRDLAAQMASMITRTHDPDVIVLGGGLGMINGLPTDLTSAMAAYALTGTDLPKIVQASQGDASGALGAAIYAKQTLLEAS